jgi:hypothetical protein
MATILNLGTPGTTPGILQPKQSYRFIVQFQNMGGAQDSQVVTRQCISAGKPQITFNQIELHRYNSKAYVAGKHEWSPLALILEDDIGNGAAVIVQAQLERQLTLVADGAAPLGLSAGVSGGAYKFNTTILQLDGTGADSGEPNFVEKWTLQGCWIQDAAFGELAAENDAALQITLSLRYDHAFVEYNNTVEPQSALVGE